MADQELGTAITAIVTYFSKAAIALQLIQERRHVPQKATRKSFKSGSGNSIGEQQMLEKNLLRSLLVGASKVRDEYHEYFEAHREDFQHGDDEALFQLSQCKTDAKVVYQILEFLDDISLEYCKKLREMADRCQFRTQAAMAGLGLRIVQRKEDESAMSEVNQAPREYDTASSARESPQEQICESPVTTVPDVARTTPHEQVLQVIEEYEAGPARILETVTENVPETIQEHPSEDISEHQASQPRRKRAATLPSQHIASCHVEQPPESPWPEPLCVAKSPQEMRANYARRQKNEVHPALRWRLSALDDSALGEDGVSEKIIHAINDIQVDSIGGPTLQTEQVAPNHFRQQSRSNTVNSGHGSSSSIYSEPLSYSGESSQRSRASSNTTNTSFKSRQSLDEEERPKTSPGPSPITPAVSTPHLPETLRQTSSPNVVQASQKDTCTSKAPLRKPHPIYTQSSHPLYSLRATSELNVSKSVHTSHSKRPSLPRLYPRRGSTATRSSVDLSNIGPSLCPGALQMQDDLMQTLQAARRPFGSYGYSYYYRCPHTQCPFEGPLITTNKGRRLIDTSLHESKSGITYRWAFLAKSHASHTISKKFRPSSTKQGYMCVVCHLEGKPGEQIHEDPEALMWHMRNEHQTMAMDVRRRIKCVVGRDPLPKEEYDVFIPPIDGSAAPVEVEATERKRFWSAKKKVEQLPTPRPATALIDSISGSHPGVVCKVV